MTETAGCRKLIKIIIMKKIKSIKDAQICARLKKEQIYTEEMMCHDLREFAQAAKEYRIICSVANVRRGGTVRDIRLNAFNKSNGRGSVRNFCAMLRMMGYRAEYSTVAVSGCGMDMVFYLVYNILSVCANEGIISFAERDHWSNRYTLVD